MADANQYPLLYKLRTEDDGQSYLVFNHDATILYATVLLTVCEEDFLKGIVQNKVEKDLEHNQMDSLINTICFLIFSHRKKQFPVHYTFKGFKGEKVLAQIVICFGWLSVYPISINNNDAILMINCTMPENIKDYLERRTVNLDEGSPDVIMKRILKVIGSTNYMNRTPDTEEKTEYSSYDEFDLDF